MNTLKVNDYIKCHDEREVVDMLRDLSNEGYHAVRDSIYNLQIRITGVPETEYLIAAWMGETGARHQNNYCDTLEEAQRLADRMKEDWDHVEICEGYPGHWLTVEIR